MDFELIVSHIVRCLFLDDDAYEEIRTSAAESLPALFVVVLTSYLAGLGGFLWTFVAADRVDHLRFLLRSFVAGSAIQAGVFLIWVGITALILQRVFRVPCRYSELTRVMGYAFAPVALQLLIFIPAVDQPIGIIALATTLFLSTHAVQVSTIASPGQAFVATLIGFSVFCIVLGILGNGALDLAPGLFALDPNSLSVGLTFTTVPVQR